MNDKFVVRLLLVVIAVVILLMLINEYNKQKRNETFVSAQTSDPPEDTTEPFFLRDQPTTAAEMLQTAKVSPSKEPTTDAALKAAAAVAPSEEVKNEDYRAVNFADVKEPKVPSTCFPQDETRVEDLLPKDAANSLWSQVNPAGQGDVKDQNFLTAGYHIGVDTIGQSRKNPNYGIRSEPPNPRINVSIWNNSSIEYDNNRRPFELGVC